jgi:hypothetical protein
MVVIADIDTAAGREVAEHTLGLPKAELWILSSSAPADNLDFQQFGAAATGWVTREQFDPLS